MNSGNSMASEPQDCNPHYMLYLTGENFKTLCDNIQVGIVLIDAETHEIVDLNAKAEEMIGCERNNMLGHECHKFICPVEQGKCPITDLHQIMDNSERILLTYAGKRVPILKTVKKIEIDGYSYLLESFVDLSSHKAGQEMLQESERKYKLLSDNSADVIWTLDLNTRKFTYFSPSVQKLRGYTPEEAMALPLEKTLTPESLANVMKDMREGLEEAGKPDFDPDSPRTIETEELCKDGSSVFVESRLKFLRDDSGRPISVIGSSRVITERKNAEKALRESEERFRSIFENTKDGVLVSNANAEFLFANPAMSEMLGYTPEELKALKVQDIHPQKDLPAIIDMFSKVVRNEIKTAHDIPMQRKDGSVIYADIRGNSVTLGGQSCLVGVFRDITERKSVEMALETSQYRLSEAMDLAYLVNWEFDVASDIFTFDDRFYALYGTTAELEGGYQMPSSVYAQKFVHPDDLNVVADEVNKAIQATDPAYMSQVEHRIIRRDGDIRHIVVRMRITKDENGRTIKTHGANQDITERKIASEQLWKSEHFLRTLIESMDEGVMVIGTDYKIKEVNKAISDKATFTKEEIVGRYCYEISHQRDSPCEPPLDPCPLVCVLEAGKSCKKIHTHFTSSGTPRVFELNASPILDDNGDISHIIEVSRDITERNKMEDTMKANLHDLERYKKATIDRELKMIELKERIRQLEQNGGVS